MTTKKTDVKELEDIMILMKKYAIAQFQKGDLVITSTPQTYNTIEDIAKKVNRSDEDLIDEFLKGGH